jgi:hypothetical protein
MSLNKLILEAALSSEEAAKHLDDVHAYHQSEARKKFEEDHGEEVADAIDNTVARVRDALAGKRD